ncbi:hypothetical protein [Thermococcus sp.]|uniref:hypothetical protein n=1 Tax=Thermococcus sp. TaxID=35749 RepID=UPI00262EFF44|nr:hypothetical protein [Thermococcus sp.]
MSESVNLALILKDIQLMRKKLDEIEEELLKLKISELEEEDVDEEELRELEKLSKGTLEKGIPWEEAKKELGPGNALDSMSNWLSSGFWF